MGSRRRYAAEQEPAPRRTVLQRSEEPGNGVLELQRSAGNRAVAERIEVARDSTVPMDTETKKGATVKLGDLGSFVASSFSWGRANSPGGGGSGRSAPKEAVVTAKMSELGELMPKISQAVARGDRIDTVDVTIGATVIHLKDVYLSNLLTGQGDDPTISLTLDVGSVRFGDDEKKDDSDTDRGRYPGP